MKRPNYRQTIITILVVVAIYSTLMWILLQLESGVKGSTLNTLQDALWYLTETLTTVGYGDVLPVMFFLADSRRLFGILVKPTFDTVERHETKQSSDPSDTEFYLLLVTLMFLKQVHDLAPRWSSQYSAHQGRDQPSRRECVDHDERVVGDTGVALHHVEPLHLVAGLHRNHLSTSGRCPWLRPPRRTVTRDTSTQGAACTWMCTSMAPSGATTSLPRP